MSQEQTMTDLAKLIAADNNEVPMWEDAQVGGVLLAAAAAGQPDVTREMAMFALANLTNAASNHVPMWEDVQLRGVLLAAAAAGQPDEAREAATHAFSMLTAAAINKVPMWEDVQVRGVLLGGCGGRPARFGTGGGDPCSRQPLVRTRQPAVHLGVHSWATAVDCGRGAA